MGSHLRHSVLKNLPMSIHVFFLWIQIYMATDFKSVCGRRSTIGHLIKTKAGKMFLQQSSKGENSTKREIKQNDFDGILTKPLPNLEEADIMHVGKAVEGKGRREGLYIRQGSQFGKGVWHQIVGETAEQGTSNLHFNCNGFWYINNLLDFNAMDSFYASEKDDLVSPPETRWDMWSSTLVDLVITSVVSKDENYPDETVKISASPDSMMKEEMENRLGVYQRTNMTRNGRPVWKQKEGGKNYLFVDCNGHWFIWPEDQKDLGGFQLREKGKSPRGKSAWVYWEGKPTGVIVEPVQVVEGSCQLTDNCEPPKTCHQLWGGVACYTN